MSGMTCQLIFLLFLSSGAEGGATPNGKPRDGPSLWFLWVLMYLQLNLTPSPSVMLAIFLHRWFIALTVMFHNSLI